MKKQNDAEPEKLLDEAPIWIEIKRLHGHPDNPRLVPRKEVVAAIAAQLKATGFDLSHAILVRPLEKDYQIVSGHNRVEAAATAGLLRVPAWVREMDDETAFMELILCNSQGELHSLERGIHALKATEKGRMNGRSIKAYAGQVHQPPRTVEMQVCAARVVVQVGNQLPTSELLSRATHLAEIHAAPQVCWLALATRMLKAKGDDKWNVEDAKKAVKAVLEVKAPRGYETLFPVGKLQEMVAAGQEVKEVVTLGTRAIERARADIRDVQFAIDEHAAEFEKWLEENGGWDHKAIVAKAQGITDRQRALRSEAEKKANRLKRAVTLAEWKTMTAGEQQAALSLVNPKAVFTKQDTDSIEWAPWSWNPITGCEHECPYCYARVLAELRYPQKFKPSLVPEALTAPLNMKPPQEGKPGERNVFVCSMADFLGNWVPKEWINKLLEIMRQAPDWNFLILTKFPQRAAEFDFPPNVWVGTTVDLQARVPNAEKAMRKVKATVKWVSIEPMIEPIEMDFSIFNWVVIGGASKSDPTEGMPGTPEWKPPRRWVIELTAQAHKAGCEVYWKTNLNPDRLRNYPGVVEPEPQRAPDVFHYLGKGPNSLVNISTEKGEADATRKTD